MSAGGGRLLVIGGSDPASRASRSPRSQAGGDGSLQDNEARCQALLECMLADMRQADSLYAPTNFWQLGVDRVCDDLRTHGFGRFRSHASSQGFYAPLYARPFYAAHRQVIDPLCDTLDKLPHRLAGQDIRRFLSGEVDAINDYRVFRAADPPGPPDLASIGESDVGGPVEHWRFEGRRYSRSMLNYLRALAFLKRHAQTASVARVLEIGGGYGTLGEIVLKSREDGFFVDVDLPPLAAVATYYLSEVFGADAIAAYDQTRDLEVIDIAALAQRYRAVVLCPWQLPRLRGRIDLFANFISFQEMEPTVVRNYVSLVQGLRPRLVLMRNMREGQQVARKHGEVGVLEPTTLDRIIDWFDAYDVITRDDLLFGAVTIDGFHSDVVSLRRKADRDA